MLVTGIEITHYRYCPEKARHIASVCMTLKDQIVTLFCQVDMPEDTSPFRRASALVGEATRQMLRMPEFRSGRKTLEFADGLLGDTSPALAA